MTDTAIMNALAAMTARERDAIAVRIGVSGRTVQRWSEGLPSRQMNPLVRAALEKALQSGGKR